MLTSSSLSSLPVENVFQHRQIPLNVVQKERMLANTVTVQSTEAVALIHFRKAENFQYHVMHIRLPRFCCSIRLSIINLCHHHCQVKLLAISSNLIHTVLSTSALLIFTDAPSENIQLHPFRTQRNEVFRHQ